MHAEQRLIVSHQKEIRGLKGPCEIEHPVDVAAVSLISGQPLQTATHAVFSGIDFQWDFAWIVDISMVHRDECASADAAQIDAVDIDAVRVVKFRHGTSEKPNCSAAVVHTSPDGLDKCRGHRSTQRRFNGQVDWKQPVIHGGHGIPHRCEVLAKWNDVKIVVAAIQKESPMGNDDERSVAPCVSHRRVHVHVQFHHISIHRVLSVDQSIVHIEPVEGTRVSVSVTVTIFLSNGSLRGCQQEDNTKGRHPSARESLVHFKLFRFNRTAKLRALPPFEGPCPKLLSIFDA